MVSKGQLSEISADFLFPKIFQAFRMAIQPGKLTTGFLAITVICLAGWVMDVSKTVVVGEGISELRVYITNPSQMEEFLEDNKDTDKRRGVFGTLWHFGASKFHHSLDSLSEFDIAGVKNNVSEYLMAIGWAFRYHFFYCAIFFLIMLATISFAGGALCRIAALQFARDEKPGIIEAMRFSCKNFSSFFVAPLTPVGIIIFIAMFLLFLGLLTNIPFLGELIMGFSILPALVAGAGIAAVVILTVAGFGLMFPAVAYDGSDCFDAMGRAWHYVSKKPWRLAFYMLVTVIYGAICYVVVRFFAFLLLWITHRLLMLWVFVETSEGVNKLQAIWPEPSFANLYNSSGLPSVHGTGYIAAFLVHVSSLFLVCLLASFLISFYFSANTIIYAIMRNRIDGTALADIHDDFTEVEAESAGFKSDFEQTIDESEAKDETGLSD